MRRSRPIAIVVAFLGALVALVAAVTTSASAPASAASGDAVSIRSIDTRAFPTIKVNALFTGAKPDLSGVSIRENGKIVNDIHVAPLSEAQTPVGIVLVIDTSGSMKAAAKLERAKAAAGQFVADKQPNDQIALVSFDNEARVAVNFTTDPGPLQAAIAGLKPQGETALWDAVRLASGLFTDRTDLLPYLVVLSDGADTVSHANAEAAFGSAKAVGSAVFTIVLTGGGESDAPALQRLAAETGGEAVETTDSRQLDSIFSRVQHVLSNQYEITWKSAVHDTSSLEVTVKVGAALATGHAPVKAVGVGSATQPRVLTSATAPGPLNSSNGLFLVVVIVALAAAAFGIAVTVYARRSSPALDIIDAYSRGSAPAPTSVTTDRALMPDVVRRAVETGARIAGGSSVLAQLERRLDQADVKLKAQEFVVFYAAGVVALSLLAAVASGPMIGLAAFILVALAPLAVLSQLAGRRQKAFTNQLPDALQLLASSLRAGYSLSQGLEAVAAEMEDPMGRELRRAVLETRLGRDIEVALDDTARRMQSPDFDWVVIAIRIQREVGGNLAELLSSVAETMVQRERLRREVSALTAEGKMSAIVVGALPILIAAALYVLNPGYLGPLFSTTIGKGMVLGAVLLTCAGFAWMKKVITIDV